MLLLSLAGLVLLILSGVLLDMHRRAWRQTEQQQDLGRWQQRAAQAQYRRRMQASSLIGVVGVLMMIEPVVPAEPLIFALYTLLLVLVSGGILAFGVLDAIAMALEIHTAREKTDRAQQKLEAELQAVLERCK